MAGAEGLLMRFPVNGWGRKPNINAATLIKKTYASSEDSKRMANVPAHNEPILFLFYPLRLVLWILKSRIPGQLDGNKARRRLL